MPSEVFHVFPREGGFAVASDQFGELSIDMVWGSSYTFKTEDVALTTLRQTIERILLQAHLKENHDSN